MKNIRQLTIILTLFISTFCFNLNVHAAKPLTCIYQKAYPEHPKLVLIQKEDGTINMWTNDKDVSIKSDGWKKAEISGGTTVHVLNFSDELRKIESEYVSNGHLISCPPASVKKIGYFGHKAGSSAFLVPYKNGPYAAYESIIESDKIIPSEKVKKDNDYSMTCVYKKKNDYDYSLALTQDSNGQKKLYRNKDNKAVTEEGWEDLHRDTFTVLDYSAFQRKGVDSSLYITEDEILLRCPPYVNSNGDIDYDSDYSALDVERSDETKLLKVNVQEEEIDDDIVIDAKKCDAIDKSKLPWASKSNEVMRCLYCRDDLATKTVQVFQTSYFKESEITGKVVFYGINQMKEKFLPENLDENSVNQLYQNSLSVDKGGCPGSLTIDFSSGKYIVLTGADEKKGLVYKGIGREGNIYLESVDPYEPIITINLKDKLKSCEEIFEGDGGKRILDILILLRKVLQISVPIIIIALGSVDLVKAIIASDDDQMKKAQKKFVSRLLLGVGFFLIPFVIKLLLTIASQIWPIISADLCGIL